MFKNFTLNGADGDKAFTRNGAFATSGGVGQAWTRPYVSFVPDRDAKYMSVGARVVSMAQATAGQEHLNAQYLTNWQLERMPPTTTQPRAYSPPREVQVFVKPDRLNYVVNPTFATVTTGWAAGSGGALSRVSDGGNFVGEYVANGGGSDAVVTATTIAPTFPGETWTLSTDLRMMGQSTNYRIQLRWWTAASTYISDSSIVVTAANLSLTEYRRVSGTAVAPSNAAFVAARISPSTTLTNGNGFRFDRVVLEKTDEVLPYFDGSLGDDYLWETGKTANVNARSFYYEKRLDRGEAVKRAIRDAVPNGIGAGTAQFGVFVG